MLKSCDHDVWSIKLAFYSTVNLHFKHHKVVFNLWELSGWTKPGSIIKLCLSQRLLPAQSKMQFKNSTNGTRTMLTSVSDKNNSSPHHRIWCGPDLGHNCLLSGVTLLHLPKFVKPNGSNSDNKISRFTSVVKLNKRFTLLSLCKSMVSLSHDLCASYQTWRKHAQCPLRQAPLMVITSMSKCCITCCSRLSESPDVKMVSMIK